MTKHILKFIFGGVVVACLGWFLFAGLRYLAAKNTPDTDLEVMKQFEELEKRYAEDPYGGETPEETLRLFIDALKKGDTELAVKYFVLDEQEEWREQFSKIQEKGLLANMVEELEATRLTKKTESDAFFTLVDKGSVAVAELVITLNPLNKKWKITEL